MVEEYWERRRKWVNICKKKNSVDYNHKDTLLVFMWLGPVLLYNPKPAGLTVTNIDSILSLSFFKLRAHTNTWKQSREIERKAWRGQRKWGKWRNLTPVASLQWFYSFPLNADNIKQWRALQTNGTALELGFEFTASCVVRKPLPRPLITHCCIKTYDRKW